MSKPKKYLEEIRNLTFINETLKIKKNDVVEYFIAKHNQVTYNSLYQNVQRFFILQIDEVNVESPALYQNQSFSYRFREPGVYNISCLNYPKMKQVVIVEGKESLQSITDIRNSEATSEVSFPAINSIFKESEENQMSYLNQSIEPEFNEISVCLHLIREGCPAFSIKTKFNELFEGKCDDEKNDILNELEDSSIHKNIIKIAKRNNSPEKWSELVNDEQEDLFKVHQLNKLSPNNLFVLLTKLKTKYVKEDIDKTTKNFKTFDDLALYCKNNYKRPVPKSNFDDRAVINRALKIIQKRFD